MAPAKKTGIVLFLLIGFIAVMLIFFSDSGPSPVVETQTRLRELESHVLRFAIDSNRLPRTLQELGLPEEFISDHAGTPFLYEVEGTRVTISSLGADGKEGGAAFNSDKVVTFEWEPAK